MAGKGKVVCLYFLWEAYIFCGKGGLGGLEVLGELLTYVLPPINIYIIKIY